MAQRNSYQKNDRQNNFDLDDYINEKSNPTEDSFSKETELEKSSSWVKNSLLILGLAIVTLLYFNNWSPTQVYGNIFGVEEYQNRISDPIIINEGDLTPEELEAATAGLAKLLELEVLEQFGNLDNLESLENLEGLESLEELSNLESLEGLQNLESSLSNLENLEEMNELRTFALETAMEALRGIGESEEFAETVGGAAQLGIKEALKELENLREIEGNGVEQVITDATNANISLSEYSNQLTEAGISDAFNSTDIQNLHQANIPFTYLAQLNELKLLEKLDTNSIIEAFKARD
ncbi:MAG: hypothetical protein RLN90_12570 [Balneolaceae bacterium]